MSSWDKYSRVAEGWTAEAYVNAPAYLAARARLIAAMGPAIAPGDTVLDLACGDGGLGEYLSDYRYVGVDANAEMVAAARRHGRDVVLADMNDYEPPEPVEVTTIFRAIYYARDRAELLRGIEGYTEKKLVFDLNPRQYRVADVRADLRAVGFDRLALRPFFVPQTQRPSTWFRLLERPRPVARLVLTQRFTYMCCAWREDAS